MTVRTGLVAVIVMLTAGCGATEESAVETLSSTDPPATVGSEPVDGEPAIVEPSDDEPLAALQAARQRWAAAGIDDHTLVVQNDCGECDPAERAVGEVVTWGGQTYASGPTLTVEGVFTRIEEALADGREVVATYDETTGYPSDVRIDPSLAEVDGGTHLIIHDVREGLPGQAFSSSSLEDAMATWAATHPPSYEYVLTVACGGCPFEGRLYARVVGDKVVEQIFEPAGDSGEEASGETIDELFRDLSDLFSSDGGLVDSGVLINGTAEYDPDYGYPNWIGLDLEILEPDEWNQQLPPRLVYMISRFTPLGMDEYCTEIDDLISLEPTRQSDSPYLLRLQRLADMAPPEHKELWRLLRVLADEPFDYANFNPAADALDEAADSLTAACPALGFFVLNDDGYLVRLQ